MDSIKSSDPTQKNRKPSTILPPVCPYCMSKKIPIWVHGHYQCADCKININPCCEGGLIPV